MYFNFNLLLLYSHFDGHITIYLVFVLYFKKKKHIGIFHFHVTFNAFVSLIFVYIFQFIHFNKCRYYSSNFSSFTKIPTLKAKP